MEGLKSKKHGFTLAEVLITLAIIGVVAALTIPTVVRNYQKQEAATRIKKVYSALSNTTNLAIADNGPIASWDYGLDNSKESTQKFMETYVLPYLKVSTTCGFSTNKVCNYASKALNGLNVDYFNSNLRYTFALNDGTVMSAYLSTGNAVWIDSVWIRFDINGSKKPNVIGKDIFTLVYLLKATPEAGGCGKFLIDRLGYSRASLLDTSVEGNCNKERSGSYCLAVIAKDCWKISDDYPW